MNKLRQLGVSIVTIGLLFCAGLVGAEGGSITGTVRFVGRGVIEPSVSLTSYADKNCAALAEKKERSRAEDEQLGGCRKEKIHSAKGDRVGNYEFKNLPAGWYSLTISWPVGNFPIWCDEASADWVIENVEADSLISIVAVSSPFELKAGDKLEKNFAYCK